MAVVREAWQPARLIPVTGMTGADEQERRGSSAFLAVLSSVREFGRDVTALLGAPAGQIETFIEVPFTLGDQRYRPDGLIRVTRGKRSWVALLEAKTGRNQLNATQVAAYVDIASEQGFDAVVTLSNEIPTTPGTHPVSIDKRKLKRVSLHHLSWSQVHTEALIERANRAVSDPDQAWILSEFIRYLEYEKSGALDFDDMGSTWVTVRDACLRQTVRANDKETLEVVAKFDQLVSFAAMRLSRQLGVHVQTAIARRDIASPVARLQGQATTLAKTGQLTGGVIVPNAVAPISITLDLRASRVDLALALSAPTYGRQATRISWLLRQLSSAPPNLHVRARVSHARGDGPSKSLSDLVDQPLALLEDRHAEIASFTLTLSRATGTKRGQGRGSFVGSVLDAIDGFYSDVVQHLRPWTDLPPKVKAPEAAEEALGSLNKSELPPDSLIARGNDSADTGEPGANDSGARSDVPMAEPSDDSDTPAIAEMSLDSLSNLGYR